MKIAELSSEILRMEEENILLKKELEILENSIRNSEVDNVPNETQFNENLVFLLGDEI